MNFSVDLDIDDFKHDVWYMSFEAIRAIYREPDHYTLARMDAFLLKGGRLAKVQSWALALIFEKFH